MLSTIIVLSSIAAGAGAAHLINRQRSEKNRWDTTPAVVGGAVVGGSTAGGTLIGLSLGGGVLGAVFGGAVGATVGSAACVGVGLCIGVLFLKGIMKGAGKA
jgi:hypothetical protein